MSWHHHFALYAALTCLSPAIIYAQGQQEPNPVWINVNTENANTEIANGRVRQDGDWTDLKKQADRPQWSTNLTTPSEPWFSPASLEVSFAGTNRQSSVPLRLSPGTAKINLSLAKPAGRGCHLENVSQLEKAPMSTFDEAFKVFRESREYYSYWSSGSCASELLHRVAFMWLLSSYEIARRWDFIGLDEGAITAVRATAKAAQVGNYIDEVQGYEAGVAYRWSAKYLQAGQLDRGCPLNRWIEKTFSEAILLRARITKGRLEEDRKAYGCPAKESGTRDNITSNSTRR